MSLGSNEPGEHRHAPKCSITIPQPRNNKQAKLNLEKKQTLHISNKNKTNTISRPRNNKHSIPQLRKKNQYTYQTKEKTQYIQIKKHCTQQS